MLKQDILSQLIDFYVTKGSVDILAENIEKANDISCKVTRINREIHDAIIKYENVMKKLNNDLRSVQSKCIHQVTSFHCDPSGNGDSEYQCSICNKYL